MRLSLTRFAFALVLPLVAAACGQSLTPLQPFDSGVPGDDLTMTGGGGGDGGTIGMDLAGADIAGIVPDTTGPLIEFTHPVVGSFVGGLLDLTVKVTDPSGVNPTSIEAVLAGDPAKYTLKLGATTPDNYHAFFDLNTLGKGLVFLQISVRAADVRGNISELGEEVVLDNTPPWMTMNSKIEVRVAKPDAVNMAKLECSRTFSPLGPNVDDPLHDNTPEAAYEGAVMKQIMGLRARIEDQGNHAPGQRVDYISDIDPTSVTLFAVGSTPTLPALAVDSDGDGICDDVNPSLVPTTGMVVMSNQALALAMAALTDSGAPNFVPDGTPVPANCDEIGVPSEMAPPLLCKKGGTLMTFVLPGAGKAKPIYSLPPIRDPDACVGFPLDAFNHLPEGPACVLTRASDVAGNHMVSFPLHICIDYGNNKCTGFTPTMAACTGKLDAAGMVIANSKCIEAPVGGNPGTFAKSGEVRFLPAFQ